MKKTLALLAILSNLLLNAQTVTNTVQHPSMDLLINPNLVIENPTGKNQYIPNRWYVFELERSSVYWENVYLTNVIIQMEKGYDLNNSEIHQVILKYNLDSLVGKSMFPDIQNFYEFYLPHGNKETILAIARECKNISYVHFVEPSPIIEPLTCPTNDTWWGAQWGPQTILLDSVYCYWQNPTRQYVGVIDDAVEYTHTDLTNIVQYGYDYANGDANPAPDNPTGQPHGTHVTGILAAEINNSAFVAGAVNDTVVFAKVTDGTFTFINSAIINAINDFATYTRLRTYNMSFGGYSPSAAQETAINTTWSNGKLPIAAAGNDNISSPMYPASYANVVSVAAVGVDGSYNYIPASYSNYGSSINVSAPGGEVATGFGIISTIPGNTYDIYEGTSMASPLVTGVADLIFASNPFLTNTQARNILQTQVWDMGTTGYDIYYGNGMVCAICAFLEACDQMAVTISASGSTTICTGGSVTLNAPYNFNVNYQWKKNGVNIAGATSNSYVATQAGTYTLYVQSVAGCYLTTNAIVVTIQPNPVSNFTYLVTGNTVNFTNTSTGATSYSWNFGDAGTSTLTNPSHTYASPGPYNVTLTATNSCGTSSITKTVNILNTSGVEDIVLLNVNVFPNPTSEFINVTYSLEMTHNLTITLYNNLGQLSYMYKLDNISGTFSKEIDLSNLSAGMYMLEINTSGFSDVRKIIVQ